MAISNGLPLSVVQSSANQQLSSVSNSYNQESVNIDNPYGPDYSYDSSSSSSSSTNYEYENNSLNVNDGLYGIDSLVQQESQLEQESYTSTQNSLQQGTSTLSNLGGSVIQQQQQVQSEVEQSSYQYQNQAISY